MAGRKRKQTEHEVLLIGLTGGMGCGQSTVAKHFESKGCLVLSADKIAHKILDRNNDVKQELGKIFGRRIFFRNRRINRRVLGELAFKSKEKTHKLNKIVHPRLVEEVINRVASARESRKYKVVCLDAALIYETQMEKMFDYVVVVASRMKLRITRIQERDKLDEILIKDRMENQIPIEEKSKWGDFVIHNNGTLEQLEEKSVKLYKQILAKPDILKIRAKRDAVKPRRRPQTKLVEKEAQEIEVVDQASENTVKPASEPTKRKPRAPRKPRKQVAKPENEAATSPEETIEASAPIEETGTDTKPVEEKASKPAGRKPRAKSTRKPKPKAEVAEAENKETLEPAAMPTAEVKSKPEPEVKPEVKVENEVKAETEAPPKPRVRSGRRPRRIGPKRTKPPTEG
ncbi:MAG: dephospho-CoA kinase [Calditrichia bacterium]